MRIIIADDHAVVREGVKKILSRVGEKITIDEVENGLEVLEMVRKHNYDVVILDITMQGMSGLDVLKQIKIEKPLLPVLILSIHSVDQYAIRVLKAGAAGYLTKDSAPEELKQAIEKVATGRKYISPVLGEKLALELGDNSYKEPHENLSDREFQIFIQIARGKAPHEIADDLCLSSKTIGTYRQRILKKFRLKTNTELIRYALFHNLI